MIRLVILLLLTAIPSLFARDFALADSATYNQLLAADWDISQPRFSPDSTQVIFDKPGNVDFNAAEREILDSLSVELIPEAAIRLWLETNGWNEGGE